MRVIMVLLWLLLPLVAVAYHYGPGVDARARDEAAHALSAARERLAADDPAGAIRRLDEALATLPAADLATSRRLRIERAKARMAASRLAEASQDLAAIVGELQADPASDSALADDARDALAASDFYVAWLKRLEGMPRDDWEPHAEAARQAWRLLADRAEAADSIVERDRHAQNLEAVIRLVRMEPDELQGLPIPPPCRNCKGSQCRKCSGKNLGRSPGDSRKKSDDARGAGSGPPPDGSGS